MGLYATGYPNFDVGVLASGGYGVGANVGLAAMFGFVSGPTSNIAGDSTNINGAAAIGSITIIKDPNTGKIIGGAIGPAAKLGVSVTKAKTSTFGVRDLVDYIKSKFNSEKKPEEPKKPEEKPEEKPKEKQPVKPKEPFHF